MTSFPVFIELDGRLPLVVGGTDIAAAKIRLLLKRADQVSVAVVDVPPSLAGWVTQGRIEVIGRSPTAEDIRDRPLVIAATGDDGEDERLATLARSLGVLVNVPDRPQWSTFALGSIVDRDPLTIAIGTGGAAPVLATQVRASIERDLHPRIGRLAAIAGDYRPQVAAKIPAGVQRRAFWESAFTGASADAILAGDEAMGRHLFQALLDGPSLAPVARMGRVLLVGAGPGDPELLTLKAIRALKAADVILHDHLVGAGVLEFARREAVIIPVGKPCGQHSKTQAQINDLIVAQARSGKTVVRLKGGDPFVFGRAAEEIAAAQAAGVEVEVIAGITAAQGCAAAIGLPLTMRDHVRQVSLVTGATSHGAPDLDWQALARPGQAFAIYMGLRTAGDIATKLLAAGADPGAPAIIVENGTRANQRVIATTLQHLPAAVLAMGVRGPAILFVGLTWADAGLSPPASVETFAPSLALRANRSNSATDDRALIPA